MLVNKKKARKTSKKSKIAFWHVPERNTRFVRTTSDSTTDISRKKLLDVIHAQLSRKNTQTSQKSIALTGLCGIGKTQLAIEYAYQFQSHYSLVAWINGRGGILQDFRSLLRTMEGIQYPDSQNAELVDDFYQKINALSSYLLIFDDVESYCHLMPYLPKKAITKKQHILITSQSQHWDETISISVFTPQESIEFVSQQLPRESPQQILILAEQLGHLPLALSHAISYIKITAIQIKDYLAAYRDTPKDILHTPLSLGLFDSTSGISVYTALYASIEKLKNNPKVFGFIKYCSYLQHNKIPRGLLKKIVGSEHEINQSIAILRNYSLVNVSEGQIFFNMHCIAQNIIRLSLQEEGVESSTLLSLLKILHEHYEYDREKNSIFMEYLALTESVVNLLKYAENYIDKNSEMLGYYIKVFASLAMYQVFEQHEYDHSQKILFRVLDLYDLHKIKTNPALFSKIYNAIAFSYLKKAGGSLDQGIIFFKKTLALYKKQLNMHVAFALHGLGYIFYQKKEYHDGIQWFKKALYIMQKLHGDNHIDVAFCFSSMGECYYAMAQFEQSRIVCMKAIEIGTRISIEGYNFDVANAYYTLSMVLQAENNNKPTALSLEYFQKSLNIFTRLLNSSNHQDVIKVETQIKRVQLLLQESKNEQSLKIITADGNKIQLSHREIQSLFFLIKGMSAKQTANALCLSQRTIETYLNQVKKKLACRTKLQLLSELSADNIANIEKYLNNIGK